MRGTRWIDWVIKCGNGQTGYPPWQGWFTDTCKPLTQSYGSLSINSGILCILSPRTLGRTLSRWIGPSRSNLSWPYFTGQRLTLWSGLSQVSRWNTLAFLSQTLRIPLRENRCRRSGLPYTLLHPNGSALISGPWNMHNSWGTTAWLSVGKNHRDSGRTGQQILGYYPQRTLSVYTGDIKQRCGYW